MSPKFLRPQISFDIGEQGPFISGEKNAISHRLELAEAIILALLGQFGDVDRVVEHLKEIGGFDDPRARAMLVLDRWGAYLGEGPERPIGDEWLAALRASDIASFRRTREMAPAAISWIVTLTCNRRCPYCYYNVLPWDGSSEHGPADATLTSSSMERVIDEMAELGTSAIYLTGGEPLLRPDLPQLIQHAARKGIRSYLNTKFSIDGSLARELAAAKLCKVSYSLDAADQTIADGLAGSKGYLSEAVRSLRELLDAGVSLQVNAVATAQSTSKLRELVSLCVSIGVPELTVSPYMEPSFARSSHSKLIRFGPPLPQIVARLREEAGPVIKLNVGSAEAAASGSSIDCSERLLCEVGIRTLDLLPDGRVTRCRYAPHDDGLIVGDVRSQSLLDIWSGRQLLEMTYPTADQYGDSACASCDSLTRCNTRGRCVVSSRLSHGKYFAPDAACHKVTA
jgi:PqqA peptide cyclase